MKEELINNIESLALESLRDSEAIYEFAVKHELTNEQWFIDWQDKLNEISVR